MKRSTFFAGIFASLGIARAQSALEHTPEGGADWSGPRGPAMPSWMWRNKAANGECPVCGTMADPYKRKTEAESYGADACLAGGDGVNATFSVCRQPSGKILVGPMERVTRCKTCNAAFWQDAEK